MYPLRPERDGLSEFRYVCPPGEPELCFAIGIRPFDAAPQSPLWMWWHKGPEAGHVLADVAHQRLQAAGVPCSRDGGHCWVPLEVPVEVAAEAVVHSLVEQATGLDAIARGLP